MTRRGAGGCIEDCLWEQERLELRSGSTTVIERSDK